MDREFTKLGKKWRVTIMDDGSWNFKQWNPRSKSYQTLFVMYEDDISALLVAAEASVNETEQSRQLSDKS